MSDIEKAISLLQQCLDEWPYAAVRVNQIMSCIQEAVELLKEQKGVPYVFDADGETVCGVCGYYFGKAYSNCPKCGRKVDWNA